MRSSGYSTNECALCFIPPQELWPEIQKIRQKYDPAYQRWMPHINIFFPFIDSRYFPQISEYIQNDIIKKHDFKAFDIQLSRFDVFDRVRGQLTQQENTRIETLFLRPNKYGSIQIQRLYEQLATIWHEFRTWDTYQNNYIYNPHLTVGKFKISDLSYYKMQFQSNWKSITWKCDAIYLISRTGNGAFQIKERIPFCE
mmetsp:Transcript_26660/g.23473  ORF Transcript_26660/g.23473 Transcript_26660/m.23473 type:complete len:198 (+) Transcript_26660:1-594(+)